MENRTPSLIGVVLAGAGARGAYEAGALAALLPVLEANGRRPKFFVGTSAGAINAVLFASLAHLPATAAAERALALWRAVGRQDIVRSIVCSGIEAVGRYLAQLLGLPMQLTSLLDPAPLQHTLDTLIDWRQLHANAQQPDVLRGVAVTTTACDSGRTTVFLENDSSLPLPATDESRAIDYVRATLSSEHLMASAAIPLIFPATLITSPIETRGWYLDGGIRLNAPIKPAVVMGADHLVLLSTNPIDQAPTCSPRVGPQPDVRAALVDVLQTMLVDRMVEDIRRLGKMNEMLRRRQAGGPNRSRTGRAQRVIPYVFAGPQRNGDIAALASAVFQRRYGNGRWLRHSLDFPVLHRLLGGSGDINGELLSYFFFEREFLEAAITLGQHDAHRLINESRHRLDWKIRMEPATPPDLSCVPTTGKLLP